MDPDQPVPAQGDDAFLADFPAAATDALIGLAGPDAGTLLASVEVRAKMHGVHGRRGLHLTP